MTTISIVTSYQNFSIARLGTEKERSKSSDSTILPVYDCVLWYNSVKDLISIYRVFEPEGIIRSLVPTRIGQGHAQGQKVREIRGRAPSIISE